MPGSMNGENRTRSLPIETICSTAVSGRGCPLPLLLPSFACE
ncbi:hypothetical protein PC116_g30005 [Phytophthora cactorum]|nr:hypothetical protein PC116_g30005 [Phytophthora cactorum]